jgi:hypothetical protein
MISYIKYEAVTFNSIKIVTECDDFEDGNFKIIKCRLLNVMKMGYFNNNAVGKSVLRKAAACSVLLVYFT